MYHLIIMHNTIDPVYLPQSFGTETYLKSIKILIKPKCTVQRMRCIKTTRRSSGNNTNSRCGVSREKTQVSPCAETPFILSADIGRQQVLTHNLRHHRTVLPTLKTLLPYSTVNTGTGLVINNDTEKKPLSIIIIIVHLHRH